METVEPRIPPVKKKPRREKRLNVMIMGSVGTVRSFKISNRILSWAALFFVLYIPFSLVMINRYFDLRQTRVMDTAEMVRLQKENLKNSKALLRSRQHIALLEEYIEYLDQPPEAKKVENPKGKAPDPARDAPGTAAKQGGEQAKPQGLVTLSDLAIDREGSMMTINFKLSNAQPGETIGGYIHILARKPDGAPLQDWTYPQEKLVNGVPENFKRGQLFLIQRFKPILGKFTFPPDSEWPTMIRVLVYDQAGSIMLDQSFEVSNES